MVQFHSAEKIPTFRTLRSTITKICLRVQKYCPLDRNHDPSRWYVREYPKHFEKRILCFSHRELLSFWPKIIRFQLLICVKISRADTVVAHPHVGPPYLKKCEFLANDSLDSKRKVTNDLHTCKRKLRVFLWRNLFETPADSLDRS